MKTMSFLTQVRGFIFLFCKPPRPSHLNPLTAYVYKPFQRYIQLSGEHGGHGVHERAPSTAEEFKRVADEKLRAADQGVASQTSEKVYDGAEKADAAAAAAASDDSRVDSTKNRLKEHDAGADCHKRGDNE